MAKVRHSQVSPRTVWTIGLNALAIIALGLALRRLVPILSLIAIAMFVALAVDPLVRWLEHRGLRRGLGVTLVILLSLGFMALVGVTIVPMLIEQLDKLSRSVPELVDQLSHTRWLREADQQLHLVENLRQQLGRVPTLVASSVVGLVTSIVTLVLTVVTVFTLALFGLLFGGRLYAQALTWLPPKRRTRMQELVPRMQRAVSGYMVGTFATVSVGAFVTASLTYLLGVPFFLALGMMYLVLGLIPYVGSFLVAVTVSLTTLATVGLQRAVIALVVFLVYQQLEANLLQPLIQRHTIKMNPLLISLVLLIGAGTMGIVGIVLALPAAAAGQVLISEILAERQRRWALAEARAHPVEGGLTERTEEPREGPHGSPPSDEAH